MGLGGLYFVPIPEGNREPLLLALGLVLGWGSTIVGYEFGSSPTARKAAEAGCGTTHNPEGEEKTMSLKSPEARSQSRARHHRQRTRGDRRCQGGEEGADEAETQA
jgi:hypothetical protein